MLHSGVCLKQIAWSCLTQISTHPYVFLAFHSVCLVTCLVEFCLRLFWAWMDLRNLLNVDLHTYPINVLVWIWWQICIGEVNLCPQSVKRRTKTFPKADENMLNCHSSSVVELFFSRTTYSLSAKNTTREIRRPLDSLDLCAIWSVCLSVLTVSLPFNFRPWIW